MIFYSPRHNVPERPPLGLEEALALPYDGKEASISHALIVESVGRVAARKGWEVASFRAWANQSNSQDDVCLAWELENVFAAKLSEGLRLGFAIYNSNDNRTAVTGYAGLKVEGPYTGIPLKKQAVMCHGPGRNERDAVEKAVSAFLTDVRDWSRDLGAQVRGMKMNSAMSPEFRKRWLDALDIEAVSNEAALLCLRATVESGDMSQWGAVLGMAQGMARYGPLAAVRQFRGQCRVFWEALRVMLGAST